MKLEQIQPIAQALLDQLSSACVRIEIKGSIASRKPDVGDIDLVCIPALGHYTVRDMFENVVEEHTVNHLEDAIGTLIDLGAWEFDPVVKRNGPHGKRLRHVATGICADLAITDRHHWGMIATIRTGPKDFNKALVMLARRKGWQVSEGLLHGHPQVIETSEEADVFAKLGLPWIEPARRSLNVFYAVRSR